SRTLLLLVVAVVFLPVCSAQSAPQHIRDYVYGPGGRLITTAEPDTYPPSVQTTEFMSLGEIRQTLAPVLTTTTFLDWAARRRTRSPTTTSSQIRFIPTTPALLTTPETKATPRAQAPPYRCVCAAARFRCSVREAEAIPA